MPLKRGCPLCGLGAEDPAPTTSTAARQLQLRRLRLWLADLEAGRAGVSELRDSVQDMCSTCQMLMVAIASPSDLPELLERLDKDIQELEISVGDYRRRHVA